MASQPKTSAPKIKQDLRSGFGLQRCSNLKCSQIHDEKSEDYWKHAPRKIICKTCEGEAIFQRNHFAASLNQSPNRMIYIYWCDFCKEEFECIIPLSRKYCRICKIYWYTSWTYDLRAPLPPHDPLNSCIPANPGNNAA